MERMRTCQIEIPGKCMRRRGLAKWGLPQPIPIAPDPCDVSLLNARIDPMFADAAYDSVMKKGNDTEPHGKNCKDKPGDRRSDGLMHEVDNSSATEHDNQTVLRERFTHSFKLFASAIQALDKPQ